MASVHTHTEAGTCSLIANGAVGCKGEAGGVVLGKGKFNDENSDIAFAHESYLSAEQTNSGRRVEAAR
jgi:hypothetical protein